MVSGWK
jgi:uncharacterized damage-inducible protein DinB